MLASIFVGVIAAIVATILKRIAHSIDHFLATGFSAQYFNVLYFLFPLAGILITVLIVQKLFKGNLGRGIGNVLVTIFKKQGRMEPNKMYSHVITSGVTVGFGGSVGLEAPIAITGSAIGSNVAQFFKMPTKERVLLLGAGAAAGIAAVFDVPVAGVIFALEVILVEFALPAFIPLLLASATATLISQSLGNYQLFHFVTDNYRLQDVPVYALLGVFCGLFSAFAVKVTLRTERKFIVFRSPYVGALVGGIILGAMIFLFPPLYGEGYKTIRQLLNGQSVQVFNQTFFYGFGNQPWVMLGFTVILLMMKPFATAITIGAGGNGGIFAPSLFMGALSGFIVYQGAALVGISTPPANLIVLGMAGILAGIVHAPLTGIFLIAEITGGYALFVPLMIVSALSFFISRYYQPYSVYTQGLMDKGQVKSYDMDRNVLNQLKLSTLVETDYTPLSPKLRLAELVKIVTGCKINVFPVLDEHGFLLGIIQLDMIRKELFSPELYETTKATDLMFAPPAVVKLSESPYKVMNRFDELGVSTLPVTDRGIFVGFITKNAIQNQYREHLKSEALAYERL